MNEVIVELVIDNINIAIKRVIHYATSQEGDDRYEEVLELIKSKCDNEYKTIKGLVRAGTIKQSEVDGIIQNQIVKILDSDMGTKAVRQKGYSWYSNKEAGTWSHYKHYLSLKGFENNDINSIDEATTRILCSVENPQLNKFVAQRGLVIGNIQSGKTANFTGLMAKCIDSKVDYIVVFTGIHNTLRNQTQLRIEKDLIGRSESNEGQFENVGIGVENPNYHSNAIMITKTFSDLRAGDNRDLEAEEDDKTKIFVVKKNVSTLKTLNKILKSVSNKNKSILIIDDEADNASIDINSNKEEKDASVTNASIRQLIQLFHRSIYVAYTATPYANIFIDKEKISSELKEDLFPKDFIYKLETSNSYTGYDKYFNTSYAKQLLTEIDNDIEYNKLNDALVDFMMAAATKKYMYEDDINYRNFKEKHATMLIHISHLKNDHYEQKREIEEQYKTIKTNLLYFNCEDTKKSVQLSFENAKSAHLKIYGTSLNLDFDNIYDKLETMMNNDEFKFNLNNSDSNESLVYGDDFKTYIVIGGNTLSRGLTLEGLVVSYFGRISNTMDTMSQMARWFGYRMKYLFLTKVYIPKVGTMYFNNIAKADALIDEQLNEMNQYNQTPEEFIFMISKFGSLNPTSAAKIGGAKMKAFSFSKDGPQITGFDINRFEENKILVDNFLCKFDYEELLDGFKFSNINSKNVMKFLKSYNSSNDDKRLYSVRTDINNWIEYIKGRNSLSNPELMNWTIVLKGKKEHENEVEFSFGKLNFVNRTTQPIDSNEINLRRSRIISTPRDESLDLDVVTEDRSLARSMRKSENGLLIIYGVHVDDEKVSGNGFSLAISFPETNVEITQEINGYIN